jgi:hypothetical protein
MSTPNINPKIYLALLTRLQGMASAPPIVEPDQVYPKDASTVFLLVDDVRFENPRIHIDSAGADYITGEFVVAVMTPLSGYDYTQRMGLVQRVCDRFAKGTAVTYSDVTLKMRKSPQPIGAGRRDDAHIRIPVHVYWEIVA